MKLNPEIYIRAAEIIAADERGYCCTALNAAVQEIGGLVPYGLSAAERQFARYFKPRDEHDHVPWFGPRYLPQSQQERILALLFMHQITSNP